MALKTQQLASGASSQAADMVMSMKNNLVGVIKQLALNNQAKVILDNLCLSLCYIMMHTHTVWTNMIEELCQTLNSSVPEAQCLFSIIGFMASECEDEGIVIEETLRESFFEYLDRIAAFVFKEVHTFWSDQIINNQVQLDTSQTQKLKNFICHSFFQWIRLKLPAGVISSFVSQNKSLLELVFSEMSNPSADITHTENATDCIIQLLKVAKKVGFQDSVELNDFLLSKVQVLSQQVQSVIQKGDLEVGQLYQELFIEIGISHIKDIIESDSQD